MESVVREDMRRLDISYDENKNSFKEFEAIKSELVWGDLNYIKQPWFSYIIPVYKRADLLKETIDSVLAQKPVMFPWDIVIVDNEAGGENETELLIRKIRSRRILYYRNHCNLGPDGNYNRCIELARGKWLGMLHADDLLMNDHLKLMGSYIKSKKYGFKPLAYISPRYQEFSCRDSISLIRMDTSEEEMEYKDKINKEVKYGGKLKRFRQVDALITGYSVGLPSFGTIINRKIIIKNGGFNKDLGICEDVITPYKLAKKYRIYQTPYIMGYYRFEGNVSMKAKTIYQICESMYDFREYMFEQNICSKLWGMIARDLLFRSLVDYCTYLSRFSEHKLNRQDFEEIHRYRGGLAEKVATIIFRCFMQGYAAIRGLSTYEGEIDNRIQDILPMIKKNRLHQNLILYGAGSAGKNAAKILIKKYKLKIKCFAVTSKETNVKSIMGIPVVNIEQLGRYAKNSLIIIATTTPDFYDEMNTTLDYYGFNNKLALCQSFCKGEKENENL